MIDKTVYPGNRKLTGKRFRPFDFHPVQGFRFFKFGRMRSYKTDEFLRIRIDNPRRVTC